MNFATFTVIFYALFTLIVGMIGYKKAGSKASLTAGLVSGLVMGICAYGMNQGSRAASLTALAVALLLGLRFVGTGLKKRPVMPDVLMVFFSAATLIAVGLECIRR